MEGAYRRTDLSSADRRSWSSGAGFRRNFRLAAQVGARTAPESGVAYHAADIVKADLINRAMEATTVESPAARRAVHAVFGSVASALARGDRVVLRRFGVFHAAPRKTGVARNPRTGDPVGIPRGRVVRFRPAADLGNLPGSS